LLLLLLGSIVLKGREIGQGAGVGKVDLILQRPEHRIREFGVVVWRVLLLLLLLVLLLVLLQLLHLELLVQLMLMLHLLLLLLQLLQLQLMGLQ